MFFFDFLQAAFEEIFVDIDEGFDVDVGETREALDVVASLVADADDCDVDAVVRACGLGFGGGDEGLGGSEPCGGFVSIGV